MDKQAVLEQHALEQLRRGDLRAAHQTLSTLLRYRPNDAQLRNRIQQVEHLVKQREEAQARIQAEPLRYAHAYIQAGRLVEGLKLLRAALAKDPSNQRLRDLALEVAARLRKEAEAKGAPARASVPLPSIPGPVPPVASQPAVPLTPDPGLGLSPSSLPAPPTREPHDRQDAIQRAQRSAEMRARSTPGTGDDPAHQQAIARARALAEARARGGAESPEPVSLAPASPPTRPPAEPPRAEAPRMTSSANGGHPPARVPTRAQPWTFDLTEDDADEYELTEVAPPPPGATVADPPQPSGGTPALGAPAPFSAPEHAQTDAVSGGPPADAVSGGPPADAVSGGPPADALSGGPHADALSGGPHADALINDDLDGPTDTGAPPNPIGDPVPPAPQSSPAVQRLSHDLEVPDPPRSGSASVSSDGDAPFGAPRAESAAEARVAAQVSALQTLLDRVRARARSRPTEEGSNPEG